jgi:single-strand DNA-binding protein
MPNSSTWIGIGHLGKDAETRAAGSSQVVTFSIAYTRKRKDEETTTWFRCQWFGDRAVKVAQYLTKGKAVQVVGELYQREYEKDGAKRTSLEVDVRDVTLLGGGEREQERPAAPSRPTVPMGGTRASAQGQDEPPFARSELERMP